MSPRLLLLMPRQSSAPGEQQQVLQLLAELQRRYGIAYIHQPDLAVIRAMAHRVMVMKDGKVVESGADEDVLAAATYTIRMVLAC